MVLSDRRTRAIVGAAGAAASLALAASAAMGQEAPAPVVWNASRQIEPVASGNTDWQQQRRRAAWLGIGLSCTNCSFHTEGKSLSRWVFNTPPVLYSVDRGSPADRAGLRTGDTLIRIDGRSLMTSQGGQAFANLQPSVPVRLTYRRGGRGYSTTVRPEESPTQRDLAAADAAARESELARALTGSARRDMQRAQRDIERAQAELIRSRGKALSDDSSMRRLREYLDQARRALETDPIPFLALPAPRTFMAPVTPRTYPSPLPQPAPAAPSVPPAFADASPLRYSGRLGSAVIEARRPGGVEVVETGDSEVALTGGDLSVRIALEPGGGGGGRGGCAPSRSLWAGGRRARAPGT